MSHRVCAVIGCWEATLPMHKFPSKDLARLKAWVLASGNTSLATLPIPQIVNRTICNKHFEEKYFVGTKLARTAIPTLHLPGTLFLLTTAIQSICNFHKQVH